jgi:hypothetical protein
MCTHTLGARACVGARAYVLGGTCTCWGACVCVGGVCVCVGARAYALGACVCIGGCTFVFGSVCSCSGACIRFGRYAFMLGCMCMCWGACICVGGHTYMLGGMHTCWGVHSCCGVHVHIGRFVFMFGGGGARVLGACACGCTRCLIVTKLVIMYCNRCHSTIIRFFYPEFEILNYCLRLACFSFITNKARNKPTQA